MRGDSYQDVIEYFADDPSVGLTEDWLDEHGIEADTIDLTDVLGPETFTALRDGVVVAHMIIDRESMTCHGIIVEDEQRGNTINEHQPS